MPEGHSVHRIARQFRANFVGHRVAASSPQGRFAAGAAELDGRTMIASSAVGKQLFLEFDGDRFLRVHLGLYGAWDFAGDITVDATLASAGGRIGQTNQRGTFLDSVAGELDSAEVVASVTRGGRAALEASSGSVPDALPEDSLGSIGAPRRTRLRMAESERATDLADFPPAPIGAVRVRLLTEMAVADLRGPTACEVLDSHQVEAALAKLGPDPLVDAGRAAENRFVTKAGSKSTPIGLLLMDQSVISGIGNVYRAELLFRARLDPYTPGKEVPERVLRALWRDWAKLLAIGVETGQMMTKDGLNEDEYLAAMASRDARHYVYKQQGKKAPRGRGEVVIEDMGGRNLYWAPGWQKRPTPKLPPASAAAATPADPDAPAAPEEL
ncbi:Fpg/Nei family DNA glycosylase [Naasia lichenicola]|uniref:DNA-(apurinic or apyrimidinic site) lyase n=1 Tax=Naasia lichenicola TaxID=2565933 RepID=A0A4S4FF90_9MICO|nr:DNA glycosylase [Naasia lichenicola]THG28648.1 Fpg/Nei family DNA glycosylase [Naasia lichenicola]